MKSYEEKRCRLLLDEYYQGIISPDGQDELKLLLGSPDLPEDLEIERSFFAMLDKAVASDAPESPMLDSMISGMVADIAAEERASRWRRLRRGGLWIAAAAVTAVLIVGAALRIDPVSIADKTLTAESLQSDTLRIDTVDIVRTAEPAASMIAAVNERNSDSPRAAKEVASKSKEVTSAPVVKASENEVKKDEITEEQLRMANETIDEVQAFFDQMMAEWDNADRGVRGLLKNRGTLADSGEKDPEIIENQ